MAEKDRALLTAADVAEILQMRQESVYNWIHQGRGPRSFKIGRRRFFDARDVDAWILEQKGEAPAPTPEETEKPLGRVEASRLICNYVEQWVTDVTPEPDILYLPDTAKNIGRYVRNRMIDEGYAIVKVQD